MNWGAEKFYRPGEAGTQSGHTETRGSREDGNFNVNELEGQTNPPWPE